MRRGPKTYLVSGFCAFSWSAGILAVGLVSGCNLHKNSAHAIARTYGLFDPTSIYIDRTGDRTTALVRFKTKSAANCAIRYWTQEANVEPTEANAKTATCTSAQPGMDFKETISNLRTDTLYFFQISVWPGNVSPDKAEVVLVRETSGSGMNPIADNSQGAADSYKSLVVARLDVPLQTIEVHQHSFNTATDLGSIRQAAAYTTGCRQGLPGTISPFSGADKQPALTSVTTSGYASAQSVPHPNFPDYLRLYPNTLQASSDWQWTYVFNGNSYEFTSRAAGQLTSLQMTSVDTKTFDAPQLLQTSPATSIDPLRPLHFAWQATNLSQSSYLTVIITAPDPAHSVFCAFDAGVGSGDVPASLLAQLPSGSYDLAASLEATQLQVFPGTSTPAWVIATHDWRLARITKP